jgi:hypothetical protein
MKYYYVACDGGINVNEEYRHYFRLYKETDNGPILVEQGLKDLVEEWGKKYKAELSLTDPYPNLN